MYAGEIIEYATVEEIFYEPCHPYTWSLLSSLPQLADDNGKLFSTVAYSKISQAYMTATLSAILATTPRSWVMKMTEKPYSSLSDFKRSMI